MDTMEQFVTRSTCTAVVLGRDNQFLLAYLDGKAIPDADRELANARGYLFCGLVGLIGGKIEIECEPFSDAEVIVLYAALAFAQNLQGTPTKGDSVSWCESLASLKDPRGS
jgi:hypothetical protein